MRIMNKNAEIKNDCVLILLSSYNGEKYIKEQLDSIFEQIYPVHILIRDDGSSDGTVDIIQMYMKKHNNIELIEGDNIGFIRSFNALVSDERTEKYKWIAFCDQDDIWLPDKMEKAIEKLSGLSNEEIPTLYYSNQILYYDQKDSVSGNEAPNEMRFKKDPRCTKEKEMVTHVASGCTFVFNQAAVQMYKKGINNRMYVHDWQMFCICEYMGKTIYDQHSYIKYRLHGNNTIGLNDKTIGKGITELVKLIRTPKPETRVLWFADFLETYGDNLNNEDKEIIRTLVEYKKHLKYRMKLLFSPKYRAYDWKTTMAFKLRTLVGRMY